MANKNTTKKALLMSALSLLLCFSMLIGTTFAWFTDAVESGKNQIIAGNLDVELEYSKDMVNWNYVEGQSDLVDPNALWEPGHTEVVYLRISNVGTLALKYNFNMTFEDTVVGKSVLGNDIYLSEYLKYAVVDVTEKFADRDTAREAVSDVAVDLSGYAVNGEMKAGEAAKTVALVIYMPETVENEANYRGEAIPQIELGVNLFATQLMHEEDSFGPDYDANAILPWDGSADTSWYDANETEFVLYTAEELAGLSQLVADGVSFHGKTVKLGADLDLANRAWTPIAACDSKTYFQGTFDGQGNTIYNLNVDKSTDEYMYSTAGLFGWIDAGSAVIKNVNVDGAIVKGTHWVGVIAGYMTGEISNCSVNDATVIGYNVNDDANGDKVGGIVGYVNSGVATLTGNTVSNSTITGHRDVGGIAGAVVANGTVKNNTVENAVIAASAGKSVGAIVSPRTTVVVDDTNKAINVSIAAITDVGTDADLKAALTDEKETIVVNLTGDVTYQVSSWQTFAMGGENTKTITINGNGHTLTFDLRDSDWSHVTTNGAKLILNDLEIKSAGYNSGHWKRNGVAFACELEMNDVTSCPIILENNAELNSVTLNSTGSVYALWIYSEDIDVTVDGLTINGGRGIKIADEDATLGTVDLTVKNADFNTSAKAAILVTSTAGANINLENVNLDDVQADSVNAVWVDEDREASYDSVAVTGGTKFYEGNLLDSVSKLNDRLAATNDDVILDGANEAIGVIVIPAAYTGTLTLKNSTVASVQAAGDANIVIEGDVVVKAVDSSAVTANGKLNISGSGNLTAIAADAKHAYGIGGNDTTEINIENVHIVDVKGGYVQPAILNGNYGKNEPEGGAAIGSGTNGAVINLTNVTIDNAEGGSKSAGIGARYWTGVEINIQNCIIKNVVGGNSSAGIGGSRVSNGAGESENILINIVDSEITAVGGEHGAGIGSGYDVYCAESSTQPPVCTIYIKGDSVIKATGGLYAAGIGTGYHTAGLKGEIETSVTVNAESGGSREKYTVAMDVGFGVIDTSNPNREGNKAADSSFNYKGTVITVASVQLVNP